MKTLDIVIQHREKKVSRTKEYINFKFKFNSGVINQLKKEKNSQYQDPINTKKIL